MISIVFHPTDIYMLLLFFDVMSEEEWKNEGRKKDK
jgi:hypothetical protein